MAEGIPLDELIVLFIDCQTTGSVPGRAHIIEIGWARSDAYNSSPGKTAGLNSFLVKLPEDKKIPRRIETITGIKNDDLVSGLTPGDAWKMIAAAAAEVAQADGLELCPAVIHYASFEGPFLRYLCRERRPPAQFPFNIICTHEISRRAFSWLPRASMRAIADYFGHTVGTYRRCADHVLATACIWREVLKVLRSRHGVATLEDLRSWLERPLPYSDRQKFYPMASGVRRALPDQPGVYRMLRSNGDLLYIGKASSLKKRVNSYFGKRSRHPGHILEMLSQARKIEATVTGSALEAAIMEFDEIRLLAPPYNVAQRKDERAAWFLGSDFEEISDAPHAGYGIGPFSSDLPARRLRALKRLIYGGWTYEDACSLFAFATDIQGAPSSECIKKGFRSFVRAYRDVFALQPARSALEQLGRRFWLQRDDVDGAVREKTQQSWTPASLKRTLESCLRRDIYEVRRARFAVWLSESVLAWEERGKIALAIFKKGKLLQCSKISVGQELPAPPGYRPYNERLEYFDTMTLDRMKVLTAEVRRLVLEGKWLKLCLRPGITLDRKKLRRIFQWV